MSLELILENLDGIDESIKPLYQQSEDGKFRLQVNGIEDTAELKKALKEKDSQEKLSKQIKDSYFLFESLQKTDKENQLALDY